MNVVDSSAWLEISRAYPASSFGGASLEEWAS